MILLLKNYKASFELLDAAGKSIKKKSVALTDSVKFKNVNIYVKDPKKWTAETPNLYTVLTNVNG